jgi:hypothetical protein
VVDNPFPTTTTPHTTHIHTHSHDRYRSKSPHLYPSFALPPPPPTPFIRCLHHPHPSAFSSAHSYPTKIKREWRALPPCSDKQEVLVDRAATGFYQARDIYLCVCVSVCLCPMCVCVCVIVCACLCVCVLHRMGTDRGSFMIETKEPTRSPPLPNPAHPPTHPPNQCTNSTHATHPLNQLESPNVTIHHPPTEQKKETNTHTNTHTGELPPEHGHAGSGRHFAGLQLPFEPQEGKRQLCAF